MNAIEDLIKKLDVVERLYRNAEKRYHKNPNQVNDVSRHSLYNVYHSVCTMIDGLNTKKLVVVEGSE